MEDDYSWDTAEYQNKLMEEYEYSLLTDEEKYNYNASKALEDGIWLPTYEQHCEEKDIIEDIEWD